MIYNYFYSSEFLEKVVYLLYVFVIQHNLLDLVLGVI